jgi:hypothetical protein
VLVPGSTSPQELKISDTSSTVSPATKLLYATAHTIWKSLLHPYTYQACETAQYYDMSSDAHDQCWTVMYRVSIQCTQGEHFAPGWVSNGY